MSDGDRLESWKEIAAYLKRDVRTAQRWERLDGLPVHRDASQHSGRVVAYRVEIDAWREAARATAALNAERRRPGHAILASVAAALVLVIGISTWLMRSGKVSGQPAVRRVWNGPEVGPLGAISPDGRFVSYVDPRTRDLAVRELHTAGARRLTVSGRVLSRQLDAPRGSAFSRDSTQIAYVTAGDEDSLELRIERLDGSGNRVVFHDSTWQSMRPVGWTMGDQEILCLLGSEDRRASLAFVRVSDGRLRAVKSIDGAMPIGVSLSPDDRVILYDSEVERVNSARDIFAVTSDGAREVRLTSHSANDVTPTWMPDGRTVVFVSDRAGPSALWALTLADMHGSEPWLVRPVHIAAILGLARDDILYYTAESPRTDVYTASVDPRTGLITQPPIPVPGQFVGWNTAADWSPDGTSLVYRTQRSAVDQTWILTVLTLATRAERHFNMPTASAWTPRWSPDGRSILFAAPRNELNATGSAALFLLDVASGTTRKIVESDQPLGGFSPTWMPDSQSILFTRTEGQHQSIVRFSIPSQLAETVYRSESGEWVGDAAVSRDGRVVAFRATSSDSRNVTALRLVPLAGGRARELTRSSMPEVVSGPAWAIDGRHLFFVKSQLGVRSELWRVDTATGQMSNTGIAGEDLRGIRVHPDGSQLAFSAVGSQPELWAISGFIDELRAAERRKRNLQAQK